MTRPHETPLLKQRLQLSRGDEIALGPGKAELLDAIDRTGSLAEAARLLDLPYMLALNRVQTMNAAFSTPVVELLDGGRAALTDTGREALRIYKEMEAASLGAIEPYREQLLRLLSDASGTKRPTQAQRRRIAFASAIPISAVGGLIGVGGGEYRLPILAGPLRYAPSTAIPLNLAVSLAVMAMSLFVRSQVLALASVNAFTIVILGMIAGSMATALLGARLVRMLSNERLERVVLLLLLFVGTILLFESIFPLRHVVPVPAEVTPRLLLAVAAGFAVGLFSSVLGVAGGELIIPTLILLFGTDVKTAGTASLIISIPTVLTGLWRYVAEGGLANRRDWTDVLVPMTIGSVVGASLGAGMVGLVPAGLLKFALGVILIASASRVFARPASRASR